GPRCRLRSGGGDRGWSGGYPRATLPEVQGRKGTRFAQVVADEASDEATGRGRVRRVERRQIRLRVVQGHEIAVRARRQPAGGLGRRAGGDRAEDAAVRPAEED